MTVVLASAALVIVATPASGQRTSYPTSFETLGTKGAYVSHPDGWYQGSVPPAWYSEAFTSYCANGDVWGVLTHPQGYEILEDGSYGDTQYMMYDPSTNSIRPANVNKDGKLVPPTRFDRCAHEPGRANNSQPPPDRG